MHSCICLPTYPWQNQTMVTTNCQKSSAAKLVQCMRTESALRGHCVRTACSANTMKPHQEEGRKPPGIYVGVIRVFLHLVIGGRGQAQSAAA